MSYGYSSQNARQGLGLQSSDIDVAEGEFQFLHQLESGTTWASKYQLRVSPQLLYRKLYILAYNDAGTANAYCHGRLTFNYNGRATFTTLLTFAISGTAPVLTGLPTIGVLQPSYQTGAGTTTDGITISRPITAGYVFISPWSLYLTADTITFDVIQQVASASRAVMLLACKSMKAAY